MASTVYIEKDGPKFRAMVYIESKMDREYESYDEAKAAVLGRLQGMIDAIQSDTKIVVKGKRRLFRWEIK